jgi:hypothetical protein
MLPTFNVSRAFIISAVVAIAPCGVNAQQFRPALGTDAVAAAETPRSSAIDQRFTRAPAGKSAQSAMADRVEQLNAESLSKAKDDELYASGFFEISAKDAIELIKARDDFAQIAYLEAQSQLITSIYSTFEASSVFEMPGNPLQNRFADQRQSIEKQIAELQERVRSAALGVDTSLDAEMDSRIKATEGVKLVDRANALLDAIISSIDQKYSADRLAQQKDDEARKRAVQLAVITNEAKERLGTLQQQLDVLNDALKEELSKVNATLTTSAKRIASMPLLGATVVDMAESLIEGKYQIALVMKWSKKNERFARAILSGEALKDEPVPGRSLPDWLNRIERGTIVGSRVFTDEKGDRWFIGIGSHPTQGGGLQSTVAQTAASLKADRALMFSLVANAAAHEELSSLTSMSGTAGKESFETGLSIQRTLSAKIEKTVVPNKRVIINRTAVNEITGQEIWLVVIAVNATATQRSLSDLRKSFANVIDVTRYQARLQGQAQGMRDAQNDSAAQAKAISAEAAAQERRQMNAPAAATPAARPAAAAPSGLMDGASVTGRNAPGGMRSGGGYSAD